MKFYIGNTDYDWYKFLSSQAPEDVNFWRPGGKTDFKVLSPGAPFLFKLKKSYNAIAGIGFFSSHTFLPISIAWDTFGIRNGCEDFDQFLRKISSYRREWWDINPQIGCTILTNPIFFEETDWIETPENWAKSIVQGKSYSTEESTGKHIWSEVEKRIDKYMLPFKTSEKKNQLILEEGTPLAYREAILSRVRLGQGAFRVLLTDAYNRRCAITGEKTLPVLEAAHIKPYALSGPHFISNGILLRSDLHKLFDAGYLTITPKYQIEVSNRIKQEFQNGKEYYQFHGNQLKTFPKRSSDFPGHIYIDWHNNSVFKG